MSPDTGSEWKKIFNEKLNNARSLREQCNIRDNEVIPKQPPILYRYLSLDGEKRVTRFLKYLQDGFTQSNENDETEDGYNYPIYVTNPSLFNDPYDTSPNVFNGPDYTQNALKQVRDQTIPEYLSTIPLPKSVCDFSDIDLASYHSFREGLHALWHRCFQTLYGGNPDLLERKTEEWIGSVMKTMSDTFKDEEDKFRKSCRVLCFCEKGDSILMWSHYGDDHKGVCLEFDIRPSTGSREFTKFLYPSLYFDKPVDTTTRADNIDPQIRSVAFLQTTLAKSLEWSYEKEWRLVYPVEYFKSGDFHIEFPKPKTIYVGHRMKPDLIDQIKDEAKKAKIPVIQMHPVMGQYRIENGWDIYNPNNFSE